MLTTVKKMKYLLCNENSIKVDSLANLTKVFKLNENGGSQTIAANLFTSFFTVNNCDFCKKENLKYKVVNADVAQTDFDKA